MNQSNFLPNSINKCLNCGKKLTNIQLNQRAKFCSRSCHDKHHRERLVSQKKDYILNLKKECSVCGYNKCKTGLDFHHKFGTKKDYIVSAMVFNGCSLDSLKREVEKCIIVCRNCHAEIHEKESLYEPQTS